MPRFLREAERAIGTAVSILGEDAAHFLGRQRFQRDYLWEVLFPTIPPLDGERVGRLCQRIVFGDYDMPAPIEMRKGPILSKYPNLFNIRTCTFTFLLTSNHLVPKYIYKWREQIVGRRWLYKEDRSLYTHDIRINLLESHGVVTSELVLKNAFPISFPAYNLSYDSNRNVYLDINFSVDRVLVDQIG